MIRIPASDPFRSEVFDIWGEICVELVERQKQIRLPGHTKSSNGFLKYGLLKRLYLFRVKVESLIDVHFVDSCLFLWETIKSDLHLFLGRQTNPIFPFGLHSELFDVHRRRKLHT